MAEGQRLARVSPLKPALRGARNWGTAQLRAASYSRKAFWRLVVGLLALFGFLVFMGLWIGGVLPDVQRGISDFKRDRLMAAGFAVKSVDVIGEGRLDEGAVRRAVGARPGDYVFDLDVAAAQKRVMSLPWVDRAVVRRLWPDRIVVQIVEKRPYALWQNEGELALVDAEGEVIAAGGEVARYTKTATLPHVVGGDANTALATLDAALSDMPELKARISARVRVGNRWDLVLHDGPRVLLPETDERAALRTLAELQHRTQVLDRAVDAVDLRLADRIGIRPTPPTRS